MALQSFEQDAKYFYKEIFRVLDNFSQEDLTHIMLACGIRYRVLREDSCVPETSIRWTELIKNAIVFPDGHKGFIFPFGLICKNDFFLKMDDVMKYAGSQIKNLDLRDLFLPHYNLSSKFEKIVVASLAVRYYILRLEYPSGDMSLQKLFGCSVGAYSDYKVDLSEGINFPQYAQVTVNDKNLPSSIIHNKDFSKTHIILVSKNGNIAVSVKASTKLPSSYQVNQKLKATRESKEPSCNLIRLYLGPATKTRRGVPIISGFSFCNRHAIENIIFHTKHKTKTNCCL